MRACGTLITSRSVSGTLSKTPLVLLLPVVVPPARGPGLPGAAAVIPWIPPRLAPTARPAVLTVVAGLPLQEALIQGAGGHLAVPAPLRQRPTIRVPTPVVPVVLVAAAPTRAEMGRVAAEAQDEQKEEEREEGASIPPLIGAR